MSLAFNMARDEDHFSIRLNINKVSHAIVVENSTSVAWTHLMAADLFIIIDGHRSLTPLQLRVLHGNTCIEDVELSRLIDSATIKQQNAAHSRIALAPDQLPIFSMTQEPRLALRYDLSNGRYRRLQFLMKSPADHEQLETLFRRRGMLFKEQRPNSAVTHVQITSEAKRAVADSPYFPSKSTQSQPLYSESMQCGGPHLSNPHTIEAGSLSSRSLDEPQHIGRATTRFASSSQGNMRQTRPPPLLDTSAVVTVAETTSMVPTVAQVHRSSTTPYHLSQSRLDLAGQIQREPAAEQSSSGTSSSLLESTRDALQKDVHDRRPLMRNELFIQATGQPSSMPPPAIPAVGAAASSYGQTDSFPKSSSPVTCSSPNLPFPDTLEHEIPPRRELPFSKRPSSSRQSGSDRSGSRPGTTTLPTSRKPGLEPSSSASYKTSKTSDPTRPKSASPLKRTALSAFADVSSPAVTPTPSTTVSKLSISSPSSGTVENEFSVAKRKPGNWPPRMNELLYGKRTHADQSTGLPSCIGRPADGSRKVDDQPPIPLPSNIRPRAHNFSVPSAATVTTPITQHDPSLRAYAAIPSISTLTSESPIDPNISTTANAILNTATNPSADLSDLEQYVTQSPEDRLAALDEFMVQNLEHPAFTILCEDMEKCWRRIALGL